MEPCLCDPDGRIQKPVLYDLLESLSRNEFENWTDTRLMHLLFELAGEGCLVDYSSAIHFIYMDAVNNQILLELMIIERINRLGIARCLYDQYAMLVMSFNSGIPLQCMPEHFCEAFEIVLERMLGRDNDGTFKQLQTVDRWNKKKPRRWSHSPFDIFSKLIEYLNISLQDLTSLFGQEYVYLQCGPMEGTRALHENWCSDSVDDPYGPLDDFERFPTRFIHTRSSLKMTRSRPVLKECTYEENGSLIQIICKEVDTRYANNSCDDFRVELYHFRRLYSLYPHLVPKLYGITRDGTKVRCYMELCVDFFSYVVKLYPKYAQRWSKNAWKYASEANLQSIQEKRECAREWGRSPVNNEWLKICGAWMEEISHYVQLLHNKDRTCIRDLKLENLVARCYVGKLNILFIDFAQFRTYCPWEQYKSIKKSFGTKNYKSPESAVRTPGMKLNCTQFDVRKNDIYSLGHIFFQLACCFTVYEVCSVADYGFACVTSERYFTRSHRQGRNLTKYFQRVRLKAANCETISWRYNDYIHIFTQLFESVFLPESDRPFIEDVVAMVCQILRSFRENEL